MFGFRSRNAKAWDHWTNVISISKWIAIRHARTAGDTEMTHHGGCHGCPWRPGNLSVEGIKLCCGCAMFQWDHSLPHLREPADLRSQR